MSGVTIAKKIWAVILILSFVFPLGEIYAQGASNDKKSFKQKWKDTGETVKQGVENTGVLFTKKESNNFYQYEDTVTYSEDGLAYLEEVTICADKETGEVIECPPEPKEGDYLFVEDRAKDVVGFRDDFLSYLGQLLSTIPSPNENSHMSEIDLATLNNSEQLAVSIVNRNSELNKKLTKAMTDVSKVLAGLIVTNGSNNKKNTIVPTEEMLFAFKHLAILQKLLVDYVYWQSRTYNNYEYAETLMVNYLFSILYKIKTRIPLRSSSGLRFSNNIIEDIGKLAKKNTSPEIIATRYSTKIKSKQVQAQHPLYHLYMSSFYEAQRSNIKNYIKYAHVYGNYSINIEKVADAMCYFKQDFGGKPHNRLCYEHLERIGNEFLRTLNMSGIESLSPEELLAEYDEFRVAINMVKKFFNQALKEFTYNGKPLSPSSFTEQADFKKVLMEFFKSEVGASLVKEYYLKLSQVTQAFPISRLILAEDGFNSLRLKFYEDPIDIAGSMNWQDRVIDVSKGMALTEGAVLTEVQHIKAHDLLSSVPPIGASGKTELKALVDNYLTKLVTHASSLSDGLYLYSLRLNNLTTGASKWTPAAKTVILKGMGAAKVYPVVEGAQGTVALNNFFEAFLPPLIAEIFSSQPEAVLKHFKHIDSVTMTDVVNYTEYINAGLKNIANQKERREKFYNVARIVMMPALGVMILTLPITVGLIPVGVGVLATVTALNTVCFFATIPYVYVAEFMILRDLKEQRKNIALFDNNVNAEQITSLSIEEQDLIISTNITKWLAIVDLLTLPSAFRSLNIKRQIQIANKAKAKNLVDGSSSGVVDDVMRGDPDGVDDVRRRGSSGAKVISSEGAKASSDVSVVSKDAISVNLTTEQSNAIKDLKKLTQERRAAVTADGLIQKELGTHRILKNMQEYEEALLLVGNDNLAKIELMENNIRLLWGTKEPESITLLKRLMTDYIFEFTKDMSSSKRKKLLFKYGLGDYKLRNESMVYVASTNNQGSVFIEFDKADDFISNFNRSTKIKPYAGPRMSDPEVMVYVDPTNNRESVFIEQGSKEIRVAPSMRRYDRRLDLTNDLGGSGWEITMSGKISGENDVMNLGRLNYNIDGKTLLFYESFVHEDARLLHVSTELFEEVLRMNPDVNRIITTELKFTNEKVFMESLINKLGGSSKSGDLFVDYAIQKGKLLELANLSEKTRITTPNVLKRFRLSKRSVLYYVNGSNDFDDVIIKSLEETPAFKRMKKNKFDFQSAIIDINCKEDYPMVLETIFYKP